ncbi:MAG: sugar phosphate isomerase/epimerase [Clostridia bacterium]|nr:sugar phosphate isomerase/epimerase [Clostridia bacterium]
MLNPSPSIAAWFGYPIEQEDRLRLIKAAGFKGVMLWWATESAFEPPIPQKCDNARRLGLEIVNAHLEYRPINAVWEEGYRGEHYATELLGLVTEAGMYGVPTLVVHLTEGFAPPPISDVGLDRFRRIIDAADRANVKLAFENLKAYKRLYEFMPLIDAPHVGVCFDAGHNHAHCPDVRVCRDFKDRIFAVHLHDNYGVLDDHLMPLDGNDDWARVRSEIIDSSYTGPWSLEIEHPVSDAFGKKLPENDPYFGLSAEEYLDRAFTAHRKLIEGNWDK